MGFTTILYGAGSWGTLSSFFFSLSALFSDIILIRLALTLAYLFLLVSSLLGLPSIEEWGHGSSGLLPWGMVFWSGMNLTLHTLAFAKLVWEERPIKLEGDAEDLWRCMYRRSGMGKLEFLELLKRGTWNRYKKGETIYLKGFSELCLHMIVEGVVEVCLDDSRGEYWHLRSGEMFDYRLFNLFGIYIGFDSESSPIYQVNAHTDCLLFTWHAQQVSEMAFHVSPSVAGFWRNLVLHCIGTGFTRRGRHNAATIVHDSNGMAEDPAWYAGARTRDMTKPLAPVELPPSGFMVWVNWIINSLHPFPPVGLRHTALPRSGMRAAARVLAFAHQDHIIARFQDVTVHGRRQSVLMITPRPGTKTEDPSMHAPSVIPENESDGTQSPTVAPMAIRKQPNTTWELLVTPQKTALHSRPDERHSREALGTQRHHWRRSIEDLVLISRGSRASKGSDGHASSGEHALHHGGPPHVAVLMDRAGSAPVTLGETEPHLLN